ncbi:hypothetical protein PROFUN_12929 [Planoprotostelium fungivorum]|uniref:Uncharacterized protein n=1 Tax=Planoprotostelium fungivorum TaxID=1890364 RepID=A0A2P6N602_9EUKA|nr:hypothetical protein PROFUN_12929 [Planoprotostelium fungivorum]
MFESVIVTLIMPQNFLEEQETSGLFARADREQPQGQDRLQDASSWIRISTRNQQSTRAI